ncbi:cobalt ECF transporter T component CbiQ [Carboxydothermus hydrogenoformans]|uniref:Cobalt transport protein n=1 Tax=Carboxydothermus hydrogenoformans (strain ATCC BAA-161 / DSM 6008 / Z-2901) TaxID=246194 RepID=Q3AE23_CARHZ|nr:cobalt ECF transporter T component CbiQ [Carboxydothermus hydrogenoformans]ABB15893.1 cobalt transport protein [Carboxydothermus hydrogenoformans Z-2901]
MLTEQLAYQSPLRKIDPVYKLLFSFTLLFLGLTAPNPFFTLLPTLGVVSFFLVRKGKIPGQIYLKYLLLPGGFLLASLIGIMIDFRPAPYVNWQNLFLALNAGGRALTSLLGLYFLIFTTPLLDLIAGLSRFGIPQFIIEIIIFIHRFIFIFFEIAGEIIKAQEARLGYRNFRRGIYSFSLLTTGIFKGGLARAGQMTISLESRGYNDKIVFLQPDYQNQNYPLLFWGIVVVLALFTYGGAFIWRSF